MLTQGYLKGTNGGYATESEGREIKKMKMIYKIKEIDYHRNGISGEGFHVIKFIAKDKNVIMLAIVFEKKSHVAVFDMHLLGKGVITFGENSWRGDNFEHELRQAIAKSEGKR